MKYWVLKTGSLQNGVYLSAVPPNGPDGFEYWDGISLIKKFPASSEAQMGFSDDYPDAIKLYDFVTNIDDLFIVSKKVKEIIEGLSVDNMEYFQLTLFDHQMKIAATDYYILNLVGSIDCIDMDETVCVMERLLKGRISDIDNLVLDESKIPPDAKMFRLANKPEEYIVSDAVRKVFEENGITNFKLLEAQGWDGLKI